jgi:hypothetical protein
MKQRTPSWLHRLTDAFQRNATAMRPLAANATRTFLKTVRSTYGNSITCQNPPVLVSPFLNKLFFSRALKYVTIFPNAGEKAGGIQQYEVR